MTQSKSSNVFRVELKTLENYEDTRKLIYSMYVLADPESKGDTGSKKGGR